jgi:hypothetical protein
MSRKRWVTGFSVVLGLTGCGVPLTNTPVNVPKRVGPTTTLVVGLASPIVPPVRVFFFRNGKFSALERQGDESPSQPERGVQESLNFLRNGVFSSEAAQGYTSPVQAIDEVDFPVIVTDGVAQINLTAQLGALRQLKPEVVRLIVGQIALTALLGSPGVGAVAFEVNGTFLELKINGATQVAPFHLNDFDCLDGTARCNLPDVQLPITSDVPERVDQFPRPDGPDATVPPPE